MGIHLGLVNSDFSKPKAATSATLRGSLSTPVLAFSMTAESEKKCCYFIQTKQKDSQESRRCFLTPQLCDQ